MFGFDSSRRRFILQNLALLGGSSLVFNKSLVLGAETKSTTIPQLPRWRGFNLLEKFNGTNKRFREDDFRNISDLGFNFVRLPMDYRHWVVDNDRRKFNEKTLDEIDEALDFGRKYGVHVCMNFHRAPGYTVAAPPESPLVWNDEDTLDVCAFHWRVFAKRYRGVPSSELSFNLFNEPAGCSEQDYYRVVKRIVDEIRSEDPERLIVCDGIDWGGKPCFSFKDLNVIQATRGYAPMEISHYGANWVNSAGYPNPSWPMTSFNGLLPSEQKREMPEGVRKPIIIEGNFPKDSVLRFKLGTVSQRSEIVVKSDGKEIFHKEFVSGAGEGEWKKSIYSEEYKIYQNLFDLEIQIPIPNGARQISISNKSGDWATITRISIEAPNYEVAMTEAAVDWQAQTRPTIRYEEKDGVASLNSGDSKDREWLVSKQYAPWRAAEKSGVKVMVGEFGAFNKTPHKIALAWMKDLLEVWNEFGWGWALWNFRGPFGVADSERSDVDYEEWRGLKLDKQMLTLLQNN